MNYGYDYGLTSGETAGLAFFGGILLFVVLVVLVVYAMSVVGQWKILKKAGQPGWPALIPFYNLVCLCKISGISPWWVLISALGPSVLALIPIIGSLAGVVISIYFSILLSVSIVRSLGKSDGWAVGLVLLGPLFYLLLGFSKDEYIGPKPMHDIVFDDWFKSSNSSTPEANVTAESSAQSRFCPGCGAKVEDGAQNCSSCGKQL